LQSCVEESINAQFETIINKFQSGGKLDECTAGISEGVKTLVDAKLAAFEEGSKSIDMQTPFGKLKAILQPKGQNNEIQTQIKTIYESYNK